MWLSAVLTRDPETSGDLLGLEAAGKHAEDLGLALGQPGWALQSPHPLPGRLDHGGDRVGVKAAGACLASQVLGRPFRAHQLAVRPWLTHRVEGVGGREKTGRQGKLSGR